MFVYFYKVNDVLICEKRYKIINTIPRPSANVTLYIPAKIINASKIRFPKLVSNKFTNRLGIANITSHNTINNDSKPTTKFTFLRENIVSKEYDIYNLYI